MHKHKPTFFRFLSVNQTSFHEDIMKKRFHCRKCGAEIRTIEKFARTYNVFGKIKVVLTLILCGALLWMLGVFTNLLYCYDVFFAFVFVALFFIVMDIPMYLIAEFEMAEISSDD